MIYRVAQARTGTGKTLAFLLPLIQNIITKDPSLERRSRLGRGMSSISDIRALIVSPTRELAEQIAVEARKVTANTNLIVQTGVGGNSKVRDLRMMQRQGCHILVGTPGRLIDLLSDPHSGVKAPNLSALVLDEADRLLDDGFLADIQAIQDYLPSRRDVDRQTLLFSATVPRDIMKVIRETMKPNFEFIRTVKEGELATHEKVEQKVVPVAGWENVSAALVELCQRELNARKGTASPFKALVYFAATAEASLAARALDGLREPGGGPYSRNPLEPASIIEMHAKLSQPERTRAANQFRVASSAIMCSSDVTARGMDFPNVTHVIQIGLPSNEEQYVHRIGRTARANKSGEGWIILMPEEMREARSKLKNMPLKIDRSLETAQVNMKEKSDLPSHVADLLTAVTDSFKRVPIHIKGAAYNANIGIMAWLGDNQLLIDLLNDRATYAWGLQEPPFIAPRTAQRLGLSRVRGVRVGSEEPRDSRGRQGDRFGQRGGDRGFSGGQRGGYNNFDDRDLGSSGRDRGSFGRDSDDFGRSDGFRQSSRGGSRSSSNQEFTNPRRVQEMFGRR